MKQVNQATPDFARHHSGYPGSVLLSHAVTGPWRSITGDHRPVQATHLSPKHHALKS